MQMDVSSKVMLCALWVAGSALTACGEARPMVESGGGGLCSTCHGDSGRTPVPGADPLVKAAPPADASGRTASDAVGAHIAHVNRGSGALSKPLACAECHLVPADLGHASAPLDLTFGALARTGGASPVWKASNLSCSATYCHGGFDKYGLAATPIWNQPATGQCGTCHGIPPAAATGHVQSSNCGGCHPGYTPSSVNVALHVNGVKDVGGAACTSCHGDGQRTAVAGADPNVQAAPPVTATGRSAGAHLAHVDKTGEIMAPAQCAECHSGAVPTSTTSHPSGTIIVAFGGRSTTGTYAPGTLTCSTTYCHGGFTNGTHASPKWTDGPMTCTSCHGDPPATGRHADHPGGTQCSLCHSDANAAGTAITNPSLHVNGVIDVRANNLTWDCNACHN